MMMPGREYQAQPSRFGFNGKENDHDVKGFGNQQDYGMRIYDTRIGRFLSTDPIASTYPELSPYQFASNTPIQAIDLDGAEAWYYNSNDLFEPGWKSSKLFSGPWTEEYANKLGYYSLQQVHRFNQTAILEMQRREAEHKYEEFVDANQKLERSRNLFGILYQLTAEGVVDAAKEFKQGNYTLGAIIGVTTVTDFGPLFRSASKEFSTIAKGFAKRYTIEQTWRLHPVVRGILIEARQSIKYLDNGFEWLAETTSPFFRKFDFYNKTTSTAVSLKTVNADKNFDFANIYNNIQELAELKIAGSNAQWGREFSIKSVQLHIVVPKGYDQSKLKEVLQVARQRLGRKNVTVTELSD